MGQAGEAIIAGAGLFPRTCASMPMGLTLQDIEKAIKTVFKEHASKLAVSSTKSMTGHMLGAAGAIEAILTVLAIENDFIPATINLTTKDPECDLDYVPNKGRDARINIAISNSFGFGGQNSSIIIKRFIK